jgi:MFS family permease
MLTFNKLIRTIFSPYQNIGLPIWILMFAIFADALGNMVSIFMSLYLHHLGYSIKLIGIFMAIYGSGGIIGAYLGGDLSDKINPLKILITSLISNSILLLLFVNFHHITILFIIVFLLGIIQHIFRPAALYILSESSDSENLTQLIGLRRVMVNLGISTASVIGGWLASINYQYVFFFDAFISFVTGMTIILVRKILLQELHNTTKSDLTTSNYPLKSSYSKFWIYIFILFINSCVFFQVNSTFPLYLQSYYKLTLKEYSHLYTISCFIIIIFEVPILTYTKKYNPVLLASIGSFFNCSSLALLPFSHNINFAYFIIILWTLGEILFFPIILNLILSFSPAKPGRVIGTQQFVYILGKLFGPFVGSVLFTIHDGKLLWFGCGVIGVISSTLLISSKKLSKPI